MNVAMALAIACSLVGAALAVIGARMWIHRPTPGPDAWEPARTVWSEPPWPLTERWLQTQVGEIHNPVSAYHDNREWIIEADGAINALLWERKKLEMDPRLVGEGIAVYSWGSLEPIRTYPEEITDELRRL